MRIPQYWKRETYSSLDQEGNEQRFSAWGWSFLSPAEAQEMAAERARKIFDFVVNGAAGGAYDYLSSPLREEIIEPVWSGSEGIGLITRNRYGALVLNAATVLIADVDFPRLEPAGFWESFKLIFSKSFREERRREGRERVMQRIRAWSQQHPEYSFRLYRTHSGMRLLFTDRSHDPTSPEALGLLEDLGSDPLYRRMTQRQECFRARLTPKPWRCECDRPPNRFPWVDEAAEAEYRQWERIYAQRSQGYVTCRFVESFGGAALHEHASVVVEIHDRYCCGEEGARLA